ncbi:Rad17 cell cycle checkpoint protein-domain-containing protein [Chytriomyces sp. MP71]|nr:Rad17 cell cycle checkpoint protein-domain-containing protein [Chytriomyces sp. MP71]
MGGKRRVPKRKLNSGSSQSRSMKELEEIDDDVFDETPTTLDTKQKYLSRQETELWVDKYTPFTEVCVSSTPSFGSNSTRQSRMNSQSISGRWQTCANGFHSPYPKKPLESEDCTELDSSLLRHHLTRRSFTARQSHRILAITGISGSGKTATLRTLSLELNFDIIEWINPTTLHHNYNPDAFTHEDSISAIQKFTDFISTARKSSALVFGQDAFPIATSPRKVILVEDLPNLSHAGTRAAFHTALRTHTFSPSTIYPIVLILSDSAACGAASDGDWKARTHETALTLKNIVPEDIRACSAFTRIQLSALVDFFNPIAPTLLIKALSRIVAEEFRGLGHSNWPGHRIKPTRLQVEAIADSCSGDIRNALNTLQFLAVDEVIGAGKAVGIGASQESKESSADVGNRDVNLVFYHALNKILVGKRLGHLEVAEKFPGSMHENDADTLFELPDHLSHHARKPLKSNPESVFESSHVDADTFIAYLAENYTSTLTDIEECVMAVDAYCFADTLLGSWKSRGTMSAYAAAFACRGTLFARGARPPAPQKFGALLKPGVFACLRARRDTLDALREARGRWLVAHMKGDWGLFRMANYSMLDVVSEVVPFARPVIQASRGVALLPSDKNLMLKVCTFPTGARWHGEGEKLDEHDCEVGEGDVDDASRTSYVSTFDWVVEEVVDEIED